LLEIEKDGKIKSIIDLFSGSGVVSRLFKSKGYDVIANDLEGYAKIVSECYLSNPEEFDLKKWEEIKEQIEAYPKVTNGVISTLYAPQDTNNIKKGERAFYTRENAIRIDTYRTAIESICPEEYKKFFLAPLLSEASIHTNTSGVFKGFHKDRNTGIGKFGGTRGNALERITGTITLKPPVLSNNNTSYEVYQSDANDLASKISADVAYLDPPYNQHPYGSNYFMLNVILQNEMPIDISSVSGIVSNWNRSNYNKKAKIYDSLNEVINNLNVKYVLLSYNSEGFLTYDEIIKMMEQYGEVSVFSTQYNTFRGCRNLGDRDIHVTEYLFLLKKV
jgi:adenine-specific DNA-methyltransferase